jgi:hypothetical protein
MIFLCEYLRDQQLTQGQLLALSRVW